MIDNSGLEEVGILSYVNLLVLVMVTFLGTVD